LGFELRLIVHSNAQQRMCHWAHPWKIGHLHQV